MDTDGGLAWALGLRGLNQTNGCVPDISPIDECIEHNPAAAGGVSAETARRQRFDALFEQHKLDIASYCSWRTASSADAEDAVAEVFLIAWRRLEVVPRGDGARAWLYATARRVTANARRSLQRRDALADRISRERPVEDRRSQAVSAQEAAVHEALAMISERDREVLLLVEWEGLRPAELSQVLECEEVTARGRLHRARARFRDVFEAVLEQEMDSNPDHDLAFNTRKARQ